jgi:hypothetical protein
MSEELSGSRMNSFFVFFYDQAVGFYMPHSVRTRHERKLFLSNAAFRHLCLKLPHQEIDVGLDLIKETSIC